ncbi:hypothetical protein JTB14_037867 [Gonioctena quinquepunctata]|nr:hypothetical protein JTB14_037867 [Gonioctena quinquepunctata]
MDVVVAHYEEFMLKYSDLRVEKWKMVGGPAPTIYILIGYLFLVLKVLPKFMENRKPFDITPLIRIYNISQVGFCCILIYMLCSAGWLQGEYSFGCQAVDYSNSPNAMQQLNALYYTYLLKIYELLETTFFVFRKKFNQVSSLHLYHHVSTLAIGFIGTKFFGGGMFVIPVLLNLVIHVFMYTYYYLSSLGPNWQRRLLPWKFKLTIAQMIQFSLMIVHAATAFQPGCKVSKVFFIFFSANVIFLYKMFKNFYEKTYRKEKYQNKST